MVGSGSQAPFAAGDEYPSPTCGHQQHSLQARDQAGWGPLVGELQAGYSMQDLEYKKENEARKGMEDY